MVLDDGSAEFHDFFERHYAELSRLGFLLTGDVHAADDLAAGVLSRSGSAPALRPAVSPPQYQHAARGREDDPSGHAVGDRTARPGESQHTGRASLCVRVAGGG